MRGDPNRGWRCPLIEPLLAILWRALFARVGYALLALPFKVAALEVHADLFAHIAAEPHRNSYRDGTASPVSFSSFDQLWISDPPALCGSEERVDAIALAIFASVVAPCEFGWRRDISCSRCFGHPHMIPHPIGGVERGNPSRP